MPNGLFVIISAPSGGGKDTVINELLKKIPNSARLVTTTSRPPRPGDQNGNNYFFVSPSEFEQKIEAGDFLEHNLFAGNYYGSERRILEQTLAKNDVVFTGIEVNGKHNLDKQNVSNLSIFLLPESLDVLKNRIIQRGGVTPEAMAERLKIAAEEIEKSADYDSRITNVEGKLNETVAKIEAIIRDRLKLEGTLDKT